ncbi:hypothetical protein DIZ27_04865 [Streptomyces sp. NWU339]|uniref:hypothetical protein n=1 Tax=Streptomyces sp. NWU339 TaxID=2185284 RepID=UPI000D6796D8|nr:hypothetical protein [Streptomyces sp. NWU339]PWI11390.1 hypothetical protein DIZ27_04865 [Streptomyces sp. NWU339]
MLLRLSYLAVSSVFAFMRLLPMSDVDKDIEILTLRHQLAAMCRVGVSGLVSVTACQAGAFPLVGC